MTAGAPADAQALLARARAWVPRLREQADAIDAARQMPQPLARAMAEEGFHRLLVPQAHGGLEVDVATFVQVTETLAQGSGSAAWCSFISCTASVVAAWLPQDEAGRLLSPPLSMAAGVFAPRGQARRERRGGIDGLRVSGRWPWGSGCRNADYLSGGCLLTGDDGRPEALPDGSPVVWSVVFDRSQVTIHDTWHAMGLRGTGSHDFEVADLWVPASRAVSLMTGRGPDATLYRFPPFGLLALGIAAVGLGLARCAIDELMLLSGIKTPQGSARPLAQRAATQEQVARAEARWRAARAWLFETIDAAWRDAANGEIPIERRRDLRLAATHAVDECLAAVDRMHRLAGGSSVFSGTALERCLRDMHVVTQHMMVGEATYELAGRLLLGLPAPTAQL